jgi:hypothetical protein
MLKLWSRWLMVLGDGMIVLGLLAVLFPMAAVFEPLNGPTWAAVFGGAALPAEAVSYHRLMFGLVGTATMGWGVMVFFVAWQPFARGESWAWWALCCSTGLWFVVDTGHVLLAGAWAYALLNATLMAAAAIPLIASRRHFFPGSGRLATA